MILLGYASMVGLGLLPLAAYARIAGVAAERPFYFETNWALGIGFVFGLVVCTVVARILGLLQTSDIRKYAVRHRVAISAASTANRRGRARHSRIRSTAAAPFARFS